MSATPSRIGVAGLGTMGSGIAQLCVEAGLETVAFDTSEGAGKRAAERIGHFLRRKVEKGQLEEGADERALTQLSTTTQLDELGSCDFVIEAVFEDLDVKRALFGELESVVPADTILATNTSALSVTSVAAATSSPERVVGMHFFNPAPLMALVEIVRGERSAAASVETATELARRLGRQPVVCDDTPGFIVNRTLIPLLNDCVRILEETGVAPEDLDRALELGAGWPMGPARLLDLVGLDIHLHAAEALYEKLRETRMAPPPRVSRMVEAGKLGRKTGEGFYRYDAAAE
ncbi:MAG TPA: 3-hydroxyacyl-CoA dehydrogenase family protein [Solirubrobacteraceae bacterium]|jgi:3-hydroxybutyryl-CoA dehydrogenase